jgi:Fe-S-cluster-containing hydrogenase component 2
MILVNYEDCKGCGDCVGACPVGAILLQNDTVFIDQELCDGCQACVYACPQGALAYAATEPELNKVLLIPEKKSAKLISVQDQPVSESLRGMAVS